MTRSLQEQYYPAPVPTRAEDLPRYLESEFMRIRESLIAQPVALSVTETGTYDVTTTLAWFDLFIGETPTWETPGGSFDPTTGDWTCPQTGLYQVTLSLEVSPFGAGNKVYYAGVAIDWTGATTGRLESTDGGDDSIPLGVTLTGQITIQQGTVLAFEAAIVHDQFAGLADYEANIQILRVSSQ